MEGFLIDVYKKEIRKVEGKTYDDLKALMGVELWQIATRHGDDGEIQVLVDEEGLFKEGNLPAFTYEGYPGTLVGSGMVMQTGEDGEAVPLTKVTLEDLQKKVTFTTMLNSSREKILDTPPVVKSFDSLEEMYAATGNVFTKDEESPSGGASPAFDFASKLMGWGKNKDEDIGGAWKKNEDGSMTNTKGLFEAGANGGNIMDALSQFYKPPTTNGGSSILTRFKEFMDSNSGNLSEHEPRLIFVDDSLFTQQEPAMIYGVVRPTGMGKERMSRVIGSYAIDMSAVNTLLKTQGPIQAAADERPFFLGEPFPTLWIECVNQPLMVLVERRERINVHAIYLWRSHDDNYLAVMLGEGTLKGTGLATVMSETSNKNDDSNYRHSAVHSFLFHLFQALARKGQLGTERMNERFRVGTGDKRRQIKIKDIVHVRLRKKQGSANPTPSENPRNIEWSHRWEVMGHWRRVNGIGKDDRGRYHVQGWTWVIPHTKGPEEKELVTKTRILVTGVKKPGEDASS